MGLGWGELEGLSPTRTKHFVVFGYGKRIGMGWIWIGGNRSATNTCLVPVGGIDVSSLQVGQFWIIGFDVILCYGIGLD